MTGNLITLADAREFVREFVNGGSCNNAVVDARLAEAEQRLWPKMDQRRTLRRMRIRVQNRTFPLPLEVEKILHVDIDGSPAHIWGPAYEYMNSGLGDLDERSTGTGYKDLVYMGEFPVMFDIPQKIVALDTDDSPYLGVMEAGYSLGAFSNYTEDAQLFLTVRGEDRKGDIIQSTIDTVWSPGEKIQINRWFQGTEGSIQGQWCDQHLSTQLFTHVSQITKPITKGPITLYAIKESTHEMFLLAKMVPEATVPSYVRYRILNQACTDDLAFIIALVKIRFRPATRADDVMSIQHSSALRLMVQALGVERSGDIVAAHGIETKAFAVLLEDKVNRDGSAGTQVQIDYEFSVSPGACNRGYNF